MDMEAVARTQPRVKQPVQHYVISLNERESETVSDEQLIRAAENALDHAGWSGHQALFAVHRDTGNAHCHVALASVNPDTLRAWNRQSDYYRLHRALREAETRFRMEHETDSQSFAMRVCRPSGSSGRASRRAKRGRPSVRASASKIWPAHSLPNRTV